ncbi:hypothetical protein [Roseiflexus sp.]|uniref:hypothetical protein n=1 Tax=Roseiflexus sp. TaxID=2562120 RepID=UPI00398A8EED
MLVEGFDQLDSGMLKLRRFLADHVTLGIGVHLNGGAVVGASSNIFGVHFAPKTIPPFTRGGEVFRKHRIQSMSMIDVARNVMARRKVALSSEQEEVLRAVFALTRSDRAKLDDGGGRDEAALRRAEGEAIRAFDLVEASGG